MNAYERETIENWVGDFCSGDEVRRFSAAAREHAPTVLVEFLVGACEARDVSAAEIEEPDVKAGLMECVSPLALPEAVRAETPALCAAFLAKLEEEGRLGGGRLLAAYVRALREPFLERAGGKPKPFERAGSKLGRNDPCPCGSGKKYKKCCMGG